ncbi:MAG: hypothetical protein PVS3B1_37020 [Ktedonobacteraceae bacterium]
MSYSDVGPEERFARIVRELPGYPGVTPPASRKRFGSSELKVQNKIFAMLVRGKLVFKLPQARVDMLIAAGAGERFDPRHDGRLMKEWIVMERVAEEEWLPLARAAMEFVGAEH